MVFSSLALKIIAVVTMFIDHLAIALVRCGALDTGAVYLVMRGIGRIAFPLFCYLLIEGLKYTKNFWKYGLRLLAFAFISELCFDLLNSGSLLDGLKQNVYFTLFLGLLCAKMLQNASETEGFGKYIGLCTGGVITLVIGYFATVGIHSSYGIGGVLMIACMSIRLFPLQKTRVAVLEKSIELITAAFGILVCCFFVSGIEYFALFSLIPMAMYNGKKGYNSKALQYGFYAFYPVHLLLLWGVSVLPKIISG